MGHREEEGKGDKKKDLGRMRTSSRDGVRNWDKEEGMERVRNETWERAGRGR